jgi:hypothetical protein
MSAISTQSLSDQARNFRLLYLDAFLSYFPPIAGAFAGAFAIRLGATNTEIGLMSSIPSLLIIFISIPVGRLLQKTTRKMFWTQAGVTLCRLGFIVLALSPWMHGSFVTPGLFFVVVYVLTALPLQFYNIGNVGMFIMLIPEGRRAAVFTTRNIISSLVSIGGVFLAGQWLSRMKFPANYQMLFTGTAIVGLFSLFTWLNMRFPSSNEKPTEIVSKKTPIIDQLKEIIQVFKLNPAFTRYVINNLLVNLGLWLVGPLYVLYTVRQLQASDAWIGTSGMLASSCSLLGWLVGRRLVEQWGDHLTARRLILLAGIYPILMGLTSSLTLILVLGGLMNLYTPAYSLGLNNLYLRILPKDQREDSIAINNTVTCIFGSVAPMVGVSLAGDFGITPVLIGAGILTILGSLSYWVWRISAD